MQLYLKLIFSWMVASVVARLVVLMTSKWPRVTTTTEDQYIDKTVLRMVLAAWTAYVIWVSQP